MAGIESVQQPAWRSLQRLRETPGEDVQGNLGRFLQRDGDGASNPLSVLGRRQVARAELYPVYDDLVEGLGDLVPGVVGGELNLDSP